VADSLHQLRRLNVRGVELSFTVTAIATLLAIAILLIFISAIPLVDFSKYALNIGTIRMALPPPSFWKGGPFLPSASRYIFASLPFAVWLFAAIEQLPLAAEESVDPKRDMPKASLGMFTLIVFGFWCL
jgi:ethanolamine permease